MFTLSNHGAQQCGAYAAAQVSHDVEKSRSVLRVGIGYGQGEFPLAGMLIHKKPPVYDLEPRAIKWWQVTVDISP